ADCDKFENRCGDELCDADSGKNSSSRLLLLSNFIHYNFFATNIRATFHSDLSAEKQDSFETSAEQLISEVSHGSVSVVFPLDDKTSSTVCVPASVMQFTQEISRKCNRCHVKDLRLIIVRFSNCRKNFTEFKLAIEEMKSRVHEQGVICFGVFVSLALNNQKENPDNSKLAEKAAELTIGALLDVPPIFNGQTFDAIT
ncbi:unnamed protein product, partial [Porites lobata]